MAYGDWTGTVVSEPSRLLAVVNGYVQGVGFRFFVVHRARVLGLKGYVKNLPGDTRVEVCAEGERKALEDLLRLLGRGPSGAEVEKVEATWLPYSGEFKSFDLGFLGRLVLS